MTTRGETLRVGTRGSRLAHRQATMVQERLADRRLDVELVTVETRGDQIRDELIHRLGTTGAFVRAIDERVLDGDLDAAVHSMKDMPTEGPADLVVAGIPQRGPPGDVLVTPDGTSLSALPEGATVGTASLRRRAQLLSERPDLHIAPLRGNVDTRVEKLLAPSLQREHTRRLEAAGELPGDDREDSADGEAVEYEYERTPEEWFEDRTELERRALERSVETEFDAICLAAAGLERSGLLGDLSVNHLDPASFVPAPGQGAIAVTALDDETADRIHDSLDHPRTRVETTVERTILAELGGGCVAPLGIYARLQGAVVVTSVRVLGLDGKEEVSAVRDLPVERHAAAATAFAADLADAGATDLIEAARREEPDEAKRGDERE